MPASTESVHEHDQQLIARCANGDRQAFELLAARYQGPLLRFLRAAAPAASDAEDLLQETFLAAWRAAPRFRGDSSVKTWLYVIARNLAFHARQRTGLEQSLDSEPGETELGLAAGWGSDSPEQAAMRAQRRECLRAALDSLAASDREVLVLRDVEGMDGESAAAVLGLPLAAMKTRLHRARLRLMAAIRTGDCGADLEEKEWSRR